jgi:outer membrane protein insertion porin family
MLNALYYDKGYMSVQIGTPRVMLTPDREGIDITLAIHEGPRYKIRQLASTSATTTGRRSSRSAGGARSADAPRAVGRLVQPRRAHQGPPAVRTLYRDAGYANVEAEPETELDPCPRRGRHRRPDQARPARAHRADRGQGEHEDARQGHPPRDGDPGGAALQRDGLENSKRRITALGYFERVDVSTEQGSAPDKIIINFEVAEKPTGHVPGRRRLQLGRELHRHGAGPAGEPLRQRPVARPAGAGLGLRQLVSLRFFEPYFLDATGTIELELFDTLYVFPNFARRSSADR